MRTISFLKEMRSVNRPTGGSITQKLSFSLTTVPYRYQVPRKSTASMCEPISSPGGLPKTRLAMLSLSLSTALRSVSTSHPGALLAMNAKKVSSSTGGVDSLSPFLGTRQAVPGTVEPWLTRSKPRDRTLRLLVYYPMGFADALSKAGVRYLAASPETMLAPGVPSDVAHAIVSHENDPKAMAKGVVNDVMRTKYDAGDFGGFGPAAAFDVLDLDPAKMRLAEASIKRLNDDVGAEAGTNGVRGFVREDARTIQGMVRFPDASKDMPWRADRPAIAFYDTLAGDGRLDARLRNDAGAAAAAHPNARRRQACRRRRSPDDRLATAYPSKRPESAPFLGSCGRPHVRSR